MGDVIIDGLNNLKPGEWQEHCRKSDAEEDAAIGHSAFEQPQGKTNLKPLFPANAHIKRVDLPPSEEKVRVEILEELLELEKEKKDLESKIERRRLLRKELLERLNQVPKRN
jgi:hypothetical protein